MSEDFVVMDKSFVVLDGGCVVRVWPDQLLLGRWMQHGDNPEARRFWSGHELFTRSQDEMVTEISGWLKACHARQPCER